MNTFSLLCSTTTRFFSTDILEYVVGGQNSWELGGVEMEFLRII